MPPFARSNNNTATSNNVPQNLPPAPVSSPGSAPQVVASKDGEIVADERLKQFDAKIIDLIMSEVSSRPYFDIPRALPSAIVGTGSLLGSITGISHGAQSNDMHETVPFSIL